MTGETSYQQLPWAAIPKFIPGTTDVTEYSKKLEFLAAMWPKESLSLLAPRAALLCEGSAFKKVTSLAPEKLKANDESGVKLLVDTLGGSWGRTAIEQKYDTFEKAIFGTIQKADETNDSYLARHDIHFEELLAQGVSFEEVRAYILLRQSSLTSEDRKRIVVELDGKLSYKKVCASVRLLGSRFFADLQGQRGTMKTKTYDANFVEDAGPDDAERAYQAHTLPQLEEPEPELDAEFIEAMVAVEDQDAMQVQAFEEELEGFFQDTPELQEALVSYLEARSRLLAKRKARGFWPAQGSKGFKGGKGFKGKGKGKSAKEQLLQRIAKSHCRACGERGHWKAECPKFGKPGSKTEAQTTVAQATVTQVQTEHGDEILAELPDGSITLAEAFCTTVAQPQASLEAITGRLSKMVKDLKERKLNFSDPIRRRSDGAMRLTKHASVKTEAEPEAREYLPAVACLATTRVEAILDTGASRCVMGRILLPQFLSQLNSRVRSQIRVTRSSVKFRFGNNQTLTSDKRILLPIRTRGCQVLWLGIEVVPGSTPLLFSKKAIKQLGGVIDTNVDCCLFKRLRQRVSLKNSATGLYLLDLADLCDQSSSEMPIQCASEDLPVPHVTENPCMNAVGPTLAKDTLKCIDSQVPSWRGRGMNSSKPSFRKYPERDNVNSSIHQPVEDGVIIQPPVEPIISNQVSNAIAVTASATAHASLCVPFCPIDHGRNTREGSAGKPRHEVCAPDRCFSASLTCRGGSDVPARAWSTDHNVRHQGQGQTFRGAARNKSVLREVVLRAPFRQHQARSPHFPSLRGACDQPSRRDSRDREGSGRAHRRTPSPKRWKDHHEGRIQGQGCTSPEGNRQRRGRSLGHDQRAQCSNPDRGECTEPAHDSHGDHAAAACASPEHPVQPAECILGELEACRCELSALISESGSAKVDLQWIEDEARQVLEGTQEVAELKKFLRKVPWHLLKDVSQRTIAQPREDNGGRHPAYVTFGAYCHGGIVGVTTLTRQLPRLTQVLTKVMNLTEPEHVFSTVAVSCNTSVEPHRDKYNSRVHPNLIVPLDFPMTGGEIWVASPPATNQKVQDRSCNGQLVPGSLMPLRKSMLLDPHMWHASAPWTGDRTLLVGFTLQATDKLQGSDRELLTTQGFQLPQPSDLVHQCSEIPDSPEGASALRRELQTAQSLVQGSEWTPAALTAAHACVDAFRKAQAASWDVFKDSMLAYQRPLDSQVDLLEISSRPDSRLTDTLKEVGGKVRRFTSLDGDLNTVSGQRALWNVLQQTQPKHVWLSPDARVWSTWTQLNAARNPKYQQQLLGERQKEQTLMQLFAKIFEWQKQQGRDCHLEQPSTSKLLSDKAIDPIVKGNHRINVDMCSFGLRTPQSLQPIRKTICIISTSKDFVRTLVAKQCPGHAHHQPLAGKLRELGGRSVCQYAGTFCRGFAEHCAKHLLLRPDQALAVENSPLLTRKRFKTSSGIGSPLTSLPSQKRAADDAQASSQRDQQRQRLDDVPLQSPRESEVLPGQTWEPIFSLAQGCTNKASAVLVPPQHDVLSALSQALPQYQVLQAFVGLGSKSLHHPLGALPLTVAPWRISIGSRKVADGVIEYVCLGTDNRTTMPSDRRRSRIANVSFLLTVFAQIKQSSESTGNPASGELQSKETRPDLEGWAPPPVPLHGPAFRSLTSEDKTRLRRIHNNLGHPSPETLARHLKAAHESQALVDAALDFQCDVCLESTEPRHQRPSKLPEPREFNEMIGIDGFHFKSKSGYRAYAIHALDEASCFQQARRAPSRLGNHAKQVLNDCWISWAGPPRQVYLDPAGEFRSEQTLDYLQELNVRAWVTVAAWQRGRLERHGNILKEMLARMDTEQPIVNDTTFDQALQQAILAKNSLVRHSGFSPEQIVFGKALRVPGSVSSDEDLSAHALLEGTELESELYRQKLELRSRARRAFLEADNSQAIRRASLRRSNPVRGPYVAGMWVLYWVKKSSPNRLAAGRWHGPAKVICSEGKSVIWLAHGTNIIRAAPENLRPASLREWQHLSSAQLDEPWRNVGGASTYTDITGLPAPSPGTSAGVPAQPESTVLMPHPSESRDNELSNSPDEISQPEQELTPQVSQEVSGVERDPLLGTAAPPDSASNNPVPNVQEALNPEDIPVPDSEEGLLGDHLLMACEESGLWDDQGNELVNFTTIQTTEDSLGPPLAEDEMPYVLDPLRLGENQAFCLEVPVRSKDIRRWMKEEAPEQLATIAAASKRSRSEVCIKDLTISEKDLFEKAKQKEISCWLQTSAIRAILRKKLNPEQILRSRWILTWKAPEDGDTQPRAKARLVVLGYQDPKLTEVTRDAPTLSREGRALVLQTIASKKFRLGSFDIKTAFLRGKADADNPLAMDPPKELRKALNLKEEEVCELLGNAYGRVDAPLLFYKELSQQLSQLGFVRHPLEPCVFLLYSPENKLHGILGMHVDDGVCGGDQVFSQKIEMLQKTLPFGSRKHDRFTFTGIHLEQLSDYSIRTSQSEYVRSIQQIDIGRGRRKTPEAEVTEGERSKLRGLVGSLQYAVSHSRPDMAAKLGEVQCSIPRATVQTLMLANKVLREAQEHHHVCTYFLPIKAEDLTFVSFGDASFASSKSLSSHQGALVCATDHRLLANQEAPLSPLCWSSKKIPRVVRSTLSAEAYAMSKAVDMLGWMRALWGTVHVANFRWQQAEKGYQLLNRAAIITDCKSLFDLVTRLAMPSCEEFRTTLEVLLIKQRCEENTTFRWVPTTLQAADCLTKAMDASVLRTILAQGRFKLYDASLDLDKNAQRKQAIEWLAQTPSKPTDL